MNTLEKLNDEERKAAELAGLLARLQQSKERDETLEKTALDAANKAEGKRKQAEAVSGMINLNAAQRKDDISAIIQRGVGQGGGKQSDYRRVERRPPRTGSIRRLTRWPPKPF